MAIRDLTVKAKLGRPKDPERVVRPRKKHTVKMRIIVCDAKGKIWFEDRPDLPDWDLLELIRYLRDNWPENEQKRKRSTPVMLCCHNPHRVFMAAHNYFKTDPDWNARFSVGTGEKFHLDGTVSKPKVQTTQDVRVSYFGFRRGRNVRYFYLVSPHDFTDNFRRDYGDKNWPEYVKLYKFAGRLRSWMNSNELKFAATRGGISSQLLKDERFYPEPRRKVPRATNEKARTAMPGNFYAMSERYIDLLIPSVYLIDQQNAHHYAAETVSLPCANSLFASGRYASGTDKSFIRKKKDLYKLLREEFGLYRAQVLVPKKLNGFLPDWCLTGGVKWVNLYSNEIPFFESLGIEILSVAYAWTSPERDVGLSQYASWSQAEIERYPDDKLWLKPALLSGYGVLGTRPRIIENAYYRSDKGERHYYFLGPTRIQMRQVKSKREIQPTIANTIHRGMIEAETRRLSMELARQFEDDGHDVLAIHADAILVRDEKQQLPLLPPPWRVKDKLSSFQALDKVSFTSDKLTVMPGRSKRGNKKTKR